ncbi:ATPase, AAA family protein [Stachybotrys elegans]|uniref:ATPase, AAA family protein n=1 Tax=Stachybotrys elegans TaxID=80388 RepID=A0A8K0SJE1_9HYPO|nr:ATPase, AAA family protein [Stachybotrys elegans]
MHAPGVRAIVAAASRPLTVRRLRLPLNPRHCFHSQSLRLSSSGNGGKPAEDSVTEHDADVESQPGTQPAGGRLRTAASSLRTRQARQRVASALPPVQLPESFLRNNVILQESDQARELPLALQIDAQAQRLVLTGSIDKSAKQDGVHLSADNLRALSPEFNLCQRQLSTLQSRFIEDLEQSKNQENDDRWKTSSHIESFVRMSDMALDMYSYLIARYSPGLEIERGYTGRPFWWWCYHQRLHGKGAKRTAPCINDVRELVEMCNSDARNKTPFAQSVPDFPWSTWKSLSLAISNSFNTQAPPSFDAKVAKRPINILSMTGYGGRSIAQSIGGLIASSLDADRIYLDAFDLSELVGDYLGQNMAYSRGAVSMMGFRAAEMSGKLSTEPESLARAGEEEDDDMESNVFGVRTLSDTLEDEFHKKLKPRGVDAFSKWDSLKIDKILSHIIRAVETRSASPSTRPLLVHLHDVVELSMTMEGTMLLGRLRALVDETWAQGTKITILGTSSSEKPSEDYHTAVRDLGYEDFVISRQLDPDVDRDTAVPSSLPGLMPYKLQSVDYLVENLDNINRMIRAINPASDNMQIDLDLPHLTQLMQTVFGTDPNHALFRESLLPAPELFNMAQAFFAAESQKKGRGEAFVLMNRVYLGPLRPDSGNGNNDEDAPSIKPGHEDSSKPGADSSTDSLAGMKLNEYEKRISSGHIDGKKLRVSFSDVHAPPETISALKLLTSLALVRPDAFAYGVLASDRIPGCLLYGPPGTGKTMLAKAVAKSSGANMLEISGATINDKWVGESEKLIRAVFTLAKKLSPCVVFIDEADSLLASRSIFNNRASHREHINQFLKEWDGMQETSAFIMVATNRPFDLDEAVLRRLPRKILVDLPMKTDRAAILRLLLRDETLDETVDLEDYAQRTAFYSGSDLKNVCVAAAMAAVEEENEAALKHTGPEPYEYPERRILTKAHFERALQQIPASISEDMDSLKQIRKFDEEYGNRRKGRGKKSMGFGILADKPPNDSTDARIRV